MSGIQAIPNYEDDEYTYDDNNNPRDEEEDDSGKRTAWEVLSWIALVLTLILNLVLVGIIVFRRNFFNLVNKVILTIAIADFLYGIFVSPFFVENYVHTSWNQSEGYCNFYVYLFTFHDLFVPLLLILLSAYISLKFSGATESLGVKRPVYLGCFLLAILLPLLLSIPAAVNSGLTEKEPDRNRKIQEDSSIQECRTSDNYTMILTYLVSSSVLFCFAMSFLFSLCIVGSPLLRSETMDHEEFLQRWRLLLSVALVNGLYIVTGFLLNFKEVSRLFYDCCAILEPFESVNSVTYDVWSFVLLILEPVARPLVYLCFYLKFLLNDYSEMRH